MKKGSQKSPVAPDAVPGAERRESPRAHVDIRLRANVMLEGRKASVQGRGNDLSRTGVSVFLPVDLMLGEQIEVELSLPYTSEPLRVRAIVRNRRSFTYGLQFHHLSHAQLATIEKNCTALQLLK